MSLGQVTLPNRSEFLAHGYFHWKGFLGEDRVAALRAAAEGLLAGPGALHTPESVRVLEVYRHGPEFVALLEDSQLWAFVDGLLGANAVLSDLSLNEVRRGGKTDRWHIDYPYNDMPEVVRGGILGLQCVLPLVPFTVETGATQLVPGSHERYRQPEDVADSDAVPFVAEPGDLLVLQSATWHRAGNNLTDEPRTAVLLSFVESWVKPMGGAPESGPWSVTEHARARLGITRG
ncbi:phytanoyl-CoA dioxygenase family protein [Micromonospora trifolii]|uniref:phytanoyl-CoA dioxygenase family protein n=1 Tax=Micromonospora trifolii TaxID=2911208 RepID=UPI003CFA7E24